MIGFVTPETAVRFTYRFLVHGETVAVNLPSRLTVDDGDALVGAGVRSVGLVMATDYLVEHHVSSGSLVRVLHDYELPSVPISVVHPPARNVSAAGRAFIGMLRQHLTVS